MIFTSRSGQIGVSHTFTADETWDTESSQIGPPDFRTIAYSGSLGGGTLQLFTTMGGITSAIPDSKLSAATLDTNGDVVKSYPFRATGNISVVLSGATAPNVTVVIL